MKMKLKIGVLSVVISLLTACNDEGSPVPGNPNIDPETAMQLIKKFQSPPSTQFRHGVNVCFGTWSFKVYKKCEHRFHGTKKDYDRLDTRLAGVRADSETEALKLCEANVKSYKLPLGVELHDTKVKKRGGRVYDCFATRAIVSIIEKRSEFCGQDYEIDANDVDLVPESMKKMSELAFLKIRDHGVVEYTKIKSSATALKEVPGLFGFSCTTCDHLPDNTHKDLINKFACLMDRFLELEKDQIAFLQNQMKRDLRNFDVSTTLPFVEQDDSEVDDILDLLDDEDLEDVQEEDFVDDLGGGDFLADDPEIEIIGSEELKEQVRKEKMKNEIAKDLSCLKKYYARVMREDQVDGITSVENKYGVKCK